ncbi:MAG: hypothetical protein IJI97_05800 [Clostridia bacterium]|nr:hypothetical protein [Clostridia bacterium]
MNLLLANGKLRIEVRKGRVFLCAPGSKEELQPQQIKTLARTLVALSGLETYDQGVLDGLIAARNAVESPPSPLPYGERKWESAHHLLMEMINDKREEIGE